MKVRSFAVNIMELQPSQLYISEKKLEDVRQWFTKDAMLSHPLPVISLYGKLILTDGHTRAMAAYLSGMDSIEVYWDEDDLDLHVYETCVSWCEELQIQSVEQLQNRIIPHKDYEMLWIDYCTSHFN